MHFHDAQHRTIAFNYPFPEIFMRPSKAIFLRMTSSVSLAVLLFVSSADIALAASRYWVGGGEAAVRNQWENTANWAATSGGAGGETIPVAADLVIFDKLSGGVNAQIRSNVQVKGLELNSAWTGSLLQGTGSIAIGTSGWRVGSGRFIGGNAVVANSGSYTQTGGIVSGLMNTFSLSGSLSITKGASSVYSTFTNTGTLIFNGNADQNFTVGANVTKTFKNLTIKNVGAGTSDDIVTNVNGGLFLSGALVITQGNLDLSTNDMALVTDRGITLADSSDASLTTDSNVTASGTILVNDAATLTVTAGTWTLNDDSDQAVDFDGQAVFNLTVNNAGGGTDDDIVFAGGPLLVSGALVVTLGGLDMTTNSLALITERGITLADAAQATFTTNSNVTASGTILVNDAATLTVTAGTWTLNDDSDQTVDFDGQSLYNLTVNNTGGGTSDDVTIAGGTLAVSNDLVVTLGNLDLVTNALALDVNDDVTIAGTAQATLVGGTMNIAGDLTLNTNGSFSQGTGTATFDGTSQTLSGALIFLNFAKDTATSDTLTFSTSDVITVSSSITLLGSAGSTLSIRSSASGTRWNLHAPATQTVAGVDVKDSRVVNSSNSMICKARCVDSGNNLNWVLFATETTTTTSDGSTGGVSGSGGGGRRGGATVATPAATGSVPAAKPPAASYRAQGGPTSGVAEALTRLRDRLAVRINKRIAANPSVAPFLNRLLERLDARIASKLKKG